MFPFDTHVLLASCICYSIIILVLVGVIDPSPQRQVKEGRKIDTASTDSSGPRLSAVNHPDSPDVLTNDPQFFNKKNAGMNLIFILYANHTPKLCKLMGV